MENEKLSDESKGTKVVIIQPERIEVPLVQLDQLDAAEDKYLWFTIFLAISSCISGVTLTSFDVNGTFYGSRWVLSVITVLFWFLSIVFGLQSAGKRKTMRESATTEGMPTSGGESKAEKVPKELEKLIFSETDESKIISIFIFLFDRYSTEAVPIAIEFVCRDQFSDTKVTDNSSLYKYLSNRIEEALGLRLWFGEDKGARKFKSWCEHVKKYGIPHRNLQDLQRKALLRR